MLGLLSFGAITRAIAVRAAGSGMEVTAHDSILLPEKISAVGVRPVTLDELVTTSDHLVLQAPPIPMTRHLFDEDRLRRMKPTSTLVNTARGPIIDDCALHRALTEGWIAAAGVDDIEEEPAKVRGIVVTPHAAYYSKESIGIVRRFAAEEVVRVLTGRAPRSPAGAG